ncbi:MAG: hypothetical protein ACR2IQ_02875 [Minisyncoccia bacterium]
MKGIKNTRFLLDLQESIIEESKGVVKDVKVTDHEIEIYFNKNQSPIRDYQNVDREQIYAFKNALFRNEPMVGMYPY